MKSGQLTIIALAAALTCLCGYAEERVNRRQEIQEDRIEGGIENGSLTQKEAVKLTREQDRIEKLEERMRRDGDLTGKEKALLERKQDQTGRHIYKEKHDHQIPGKKPMIKSDRNQKRRIVQGVKSGELTAKEARDLAGDQKRIRKAEKKALSDGNLTEKEKARLRKMKSHESRKIYRKKHNDTKRNG